MKRGFLIKRIEKPVFSKSLDKLPPGANLYPPSVPSVITRPKQTSPFFNAPEDVLLQIFSITMELENRDNKYAPRKPPLPLRLSHISSFMRSITLGAPLLWTTIDNSVLQSNAMTDAYLIRSHNSYIDINISDGYDLLRSLNKLVAHIHRWRRLCFLAKDISAEEFGQIIKPLAMASARNLVHLDLGSIFDSRPALRPTAILAGGAPVLKSLHLMSNSLCLPSGLGALKRFSLHTLPGDTPRLSYVSLCRTLVTMHSLTHLQFTGEVTRWPVASAVQPINLLSLQCLDLHPSEDYKATIAIKDYCVSSFFATFTMPSLQRLSLGDLSPEILASFLRCLHEGSFCFPHVKSLAWWTELRRTEIVALVQSFPTVENFTLMNCSGENFFKALLVHDNKSSAQSPLWPCLRGLNIHAIKLSTLRAYVSSRIRWDKPIQDVLLYEGPVPRTRDSDFDWLHATVDLKFVSYDILVAEGTGWERN